MGDVAIAMQRAPLRTPGWVKTSPTKFVNIVGTGVYGETRLPVDALGTFALTLTNVVVGSAIQIESQDGSTTLHNGTASGSTVGIALQAYAAGSPLNNLRIKVRKGSAAPYYQPYETLTTAVVGAQSIYVSQIPD